MMSKHPHIVVIGAGIAGASLTYHLAKQNARVTLIDKAGKPVHGVTGKSFAWITAGYDEYETYLQLRQQAIADWHRVEKELNGKLTIDWCGALTWLTDAVETERLAAKLTNAHSRVRLAGRREIKLLEPNLKTVPAVALFAEGEGALDPVLTTELFIEAAREAGADIRLGNGMVSLAVNNSRATGLVTAIGTIHADMIVLATGADTASLCKPPGLHLPVNVSPGILIAFHNRQRFVNRIVSSPLFEVRAASDTITVAAEDYMDNAIENHPNGIAQNTLARIKEHWRGTEQLELANVRVGKRPVPRDGLPVIGRTNQLDGLYLFVMHSGVTLAAVAARLAADDLLTSQADVLLSSYRPDRFK